MGKKHIAAAQISDFDKTLADLLALATAITTNRMDEEHSRDGSINEKNKLFVNGILDYAINQPDLKSPNVD